MKSKFDIGLETRKAILGTDHVDKVTKNISESDKHFQKFITEYAWGDVWSDPQLSKRERSMLTIAILASQGNHEELKLHIAACKNTGTSLGDMIATMMHVAIYAGLPKANSAIRLIKEEIKFWD